ncbi:LysR family transcriptional regulator [Pseudonocardia sp. KRD291]|uniref:LysR family transcriptional regulator n=1 Tax=Pseudonocardia sp. KRD291 TaxID=2792007 RepID=UPI001C4A4875|nr:LysR family transcriptional regulator [Pseudonocardia sp. KRD291]MBW0102602.1 LysR family transcriptional regulator [Pseudonocardia sp. KRD291]
MIDLRRVQVLRVVHHVGTVTAAARSLHLTPSAVSQQLRGLAREVGVELLVPDGRGVRLSPAAHALIRHADELAARWEAARDEVAGHADWAGGVLTVSGFPSGLDMVVAPAVADLRVHEPRLDVAITELETTEALEQVLSGDVDIAVIVPNLDGPPTEDPRFEQAPLLDEPQDLLVPVGHRLADQLGTTAGATLDAAADEPWVLAAQGSCDQHELALVACAAAGFRPRVAHEVREWAAVASLVSHGFGVALVPRFVRIPGELPVVRVPLRDGPTPRRRLLTCVRRGSAGQHPIALGLDALARAATRLAAPEPVAGR